MITWFDPPLEITYTSTYDWETVDISGLIPEGTVGIFALMVNSYTMSYAASMRKYGSTDTDSISAMGVLGQMPFFVGVSADYKIDVYSGSLSYIKFYILAALDGDEAEFLTNRVDKTPVGSGWLDVDLSANVPVNTPAAFFHLYEGSVNTAAGLRCKGSSDNRYARLNKHGGGCVGLNADRVCQVYRLSGGNSAIRLMGWLKPGKGIFKMNGLDKSLGQTGEFIDIDLSSDAVGGAHGVLVHVFNTNLVYYKYSLRPDGSNFEQYNFAPYQGWYPVKLPENKKIEGKIEALTTDFYVLGYFKGAIVEDRLVEINAVVSAEDSFQEEGAVAINGLVESWENWEDELAWINASIVADDGEDQAVVASATVLGDDGEDHVVAVSVSAVADDGEDPTVTVVAPPIAGDDGEDPTVNLRVGVDRNEWYHPVDEGLAIGKAVIRAITAMSMPPCVKGMDPAPNETCVLRNKNVGFYIVGQTLDQVDIDSVVVKINGVEYKKGDPKFQYTGFGDRYWIEVAHAPWNYEQNVSVEINGKSMLGQVMTAVSYTFQTEFEASKTKAGSPRLELYEVLKYDLPILTIQENWVRQGVSRESVEFELWYGRYMKLPFLESVEMMVLAGDTNALGKEILDNGWLSVRVGDGAYTPVFRDSVIDVGSMYSHSKRNLRFKLVVPEAAQTKGYFVLRLQFTPRFMRGYGTFQYGVGLYLGDVEMLDFHPNVVVYRAYVFDAVSWSQLLQAGVLSSPFYKGEDKQW